MVKKIISKTVNGFNKSLMLPKVKIEFEYPKHIKVVKKDINDNLSNFIDIIRLQLESLLALTVKDLIEWGNFQIKMSKWTSSEFLKYHGFSDKQVEDVYKIVNERMKGIDEIIGKK